jgi:ribosomal protein S27AE
VIGVQVNDIPSECPRCEVRNVEVQTVPPGEHDRGEEWLTRAHCPNCGEYTEWFD